VIVSKHNQSFIAPLCFLISLCLLPALQAELATDMNAGLSSAERRQLAELQPQIEGLEQQLKDAKKAAGQVSHVIPPHLCNCDELGCIVYVSIVMVV
jgi:hypothetical protein